MSGHVVPVGSVLLALRLGQLWTRVKYNGLSVSVWAMPLLTLELYEGKLVRKGAKLTHVPSL